MNSDLLVIVLILVILLTYFLISKLKKNVLFLYLFNEALNISPLKGTLQHLLCYVAPFHDKTDP